MHSHTGLSTVWSLIASEDFDESQQDAELRSVLKAALETMKDDLPLQQGMSQGSYVGTSPIEVMINAVERDGLSLVVRFNVFYTSIIGGCNCADDPSPVDELNECCECELTLGEGGGSQILLL